MEASERSAPVPALARRRWFAAAVLLCMVLAALLRPFPSQFKFRYGGDCVRYLTWSHQVQKQGLAAFPALVDEYRKKWVGFPPPTRWAYLLLAAGVESVWSAPSDEYHPLVLISWLASLLSLLPLTFWLRRLVPPPVVLLALLFVALSPVMRGLSHFPLPDSLQMLNTLSLVAAVAGWLARPRRWLLPLTAFLALATVTVRETGLVSVIAAGSLVLLDRARHGKLRMAPIWALLAGCLISVPLTVGLAGGPTQLVLLAKDVTHGAFVTTGSIGYVSGPYYRYLVDFMIECPAVTVAAIAAIGPLLRSPSLRGATVEILLVTVVLLALNAPMPKTLRYVMPVEVGMRALAACAVWAIHQSQRRLSTAWAAAVALVIVGHDLAIYGVLWWQDANYDPTTWAMARSLKLIP